MAPIASCEARYGGVADTKLSKSEIAASAFGGLAMTNERAADLCQLGVYADLFGIGPFLLDSAKRRWTFDTPVVRRMPYGRSVYIHIDYFGDC